MRIAELVNLFLQVWTSSDKSPKTVRFYDSRLRKFVAAFGEREFAALTLAEILAHLDQVGQQLAGSTRRHNAVAIETLQKFAVEQMLLEKPVFKKLPKPPMGRRDRIPTAEETQALLEHASPAFRLIYGALRRCGARPGELCRATIADYDRDAGLIVLQHHKTAKKTGRPRYIAVGQILKETLDESIGDRTAGPIFRTPTGKPWQVEHLSRTYTRLRKAAGLTPGLVLYLARHECGTALCRKFGIAVAAQSLGHASINTTQRYVHRAPQEMAQYQADLFCDDPAAVSR